MIFNDDVPRVSHALFAFFFFFFCLPFFLLIPSPPKKTLRYTYLDIPTQKPRFFGQDGVVYGSFEQFAEELNQIAKTLVINLGRGLCVDVDVGVCV